MAAHSVRDAIHTIEPSQHSTRSCFITHIT